MSEPSGKRKPLCLFVECVPRSMARLDVLAELNATQLLYGDHPIQFEHAAHTQADALERAIRMHDPQILHFSGHGGAPPGTTQRPGQGTLFIENSRGEAVALKPDMLDDLLLEPTAQNLVLVVLNACHSDQFARDFMRRRKSVRFVVGTKAGVSDEEARSFSQGFYQALARGSTIQAAFRAGRVRARIEAQGQAENYFLSEANPGDAKVSVLVPASAAHSMRGPSIPTASGASDQNIVATPATVTPSLPAVPEVAKIPQGTRRTRTLRAVGLVGAAAAVVVGFVAWLVLARHGVSVSSMPSPAAPSTGSASSTATPPPTASTVTQAAVHDQAITTTGSPTEQKKPPPPDEVTKADCWVGTATFPLKLTPDHPTKYSHLTQQQCIQKAQQCRGADCRYKFNNGDWEKVTRP